MIPLQVALGATAAALLAGAIVGAALVTWAAQELDADTPRHLHVWRPSVN